MTFLGDVNPEYALKYMTTFFAKISQKRSTDAETP